MGIFSHVCILTESLLDRIAVYAVGRNINTDPTTEVYHWSWSITVQSFCRCFLFVCLLVGFKKQSRSLTGVAQKAKKVVLPFPAAQSVSGSESLCDSQPRGVTDHVLQLQQSWAAVSDNEHTDASRCGLVHKSFIHSVMLSKHVLICTHLQALAAKSCPPHLDLLMRLGPMLRDSTAFRPQMDWGPSAPSRDSTDTHSSYHQYRSLDLLLGSYGVLG